MLNDDERHIPVKVRCGRSKKYADGGLASAAEGVADAGRFGDDIVVHVNRREFEEMMQRWGEPTINPETGLPEFFLGDLWDGVKDVWDDAKDYVIPLGAAAAGAFLPVIGNTVGTYLPGAANLLGSTGLQALSTGLLGAGAGALLDGGKGALLGGLGGALGAYGGDLLRNGVDGSAVGQALSAASSAGSGASVSPSQAGGMGSSAITPAIMMAALNLAGNVFGGGDSGTDTPKQVKQANKQFNEPLPQWQNPRKRRRYAYGDVPDYTAQGEREYFDNNNFAHGGPVGYEQGGSASHGRADDIEALLSPGEYVVDAETVALLGNGSTEAGAAQLDRLRQNIRKHKGAALAYGQISPDALPPENYI